MVLDFGDAKEKNRSIENSDIAYCAEELYYMMLEDVSDLKKIITQKDAEIALLKKLVNSKEIQIKKLAEQVHWLTISKLE